MPEHVEELSFFRILKKQAQFLQVQVVIVVTFVVKVVIATVANQNYNNSIIVCQ